MAAGNGIPAYRVVTPADVRDQFRAWGKVAATAGLLQSYLDDLKLLNNRLARRPKAFGDPLHDYHHAELCLYRGLTEYKIVTYAVHTKRPLVFVRSVRLRPDRALGMAE
jgi:hypothetical protein